MEKNYKTCKYIGGPSSACIGCLSHGESKNWEPKEAMDIWKEAPAQAEYFYKDTNKFYMLFKGTVLRYEGDCTWEESLFTTSGLERGIKTGDFIKRPQAEQEEPKGWKDGLPPIGVECEYRLDELDDSFFKCRIEAYSLDKDAVFLKEKSGCYNHWWLNNVQFRPIKSQAEKEREEARQIEIDMFNAILEQEDIYLHSPDAENDRANMEFVIGEYLLKRLADKGDV